MNIFDRSQHVYISPSFDTIIQETIHFFEATPVHSLPITERFWGTGVYALYCIAESGIYSKFNAVNQTAFRLPIYVGKAVPKGWRQGRQFLPVQAKSYELSNRLREHSHSLNCGEGLDIE
ncbi:MAG: Eco29kI family restriction endonuclease [Cyanobacteriota bacterium]|nr:Eco29kI family restriction endonuclease [Cyanobacteriota bacterium]